MLKVKDLVSVQKVDPVVSLAEYDPHSIVSSYIFTKLLEERVDLLLARLVNPTDRNSFMIIGNYGTGKSHLLAFLASVLKDSALQDDIRSNRVKATAAKLTDQKFFIAEYALQPIRKSLHDIFFDRVLRTLEDNGIAITFADTEYDITERMEKILKDLANRFGGQTRLVVILDELGEFLMSKKDEELMADLGFLRVLGEISKTHTVSLIASLQEDMLHPDNPKMRPYSEHVNRIIRRFEKIPIISEDLKKVASERVLVKTNGQRKNLQNIYSTFRDKFPNLPFGETDFCDIYPIHPQVFDIYDQLRYIENWSVLTFIADEAKKIEDEQATTVITVDRVWDVHKDELESSPEAVGYVRAYESLKRNVLPRVDEDFKGLASKVLDALAAFSSVGKGVTATELVNALLAGEFEGKENYSLMETVVKDLVRKAGGEFFQVTGEGAETIYRIVPGIGVDVESLIETRSSMIDDNDIELATVTTASYLAEFLRKDKIDPNEPIEEDLYWSTGNTKRCGKLLFITESATWQMHEGFLGPNVDFLLCISTPLLKIDRSDIKDPRVMLWEPGELSPEDRKYLKRDLAIRKLRKRKEEEGETTIVAALNGRHVETIKPRVKEALEKLYYDEGKIGGPRPIDDVKLEIFKENFEDFKTNIFKDMLDTYYDKHPRFERHFLGGQQTSKLLQGFIWPRQIAEDEDETVVSYVKDFAIPLDLAIKAGDVYRLNPDSDYLRELDGRISAAKSEFVDLDALYMQFRQKPYGMLKPILDLLLLTLFRLGKIILVTAKGERFPVTRWEEAIKLGLSKFKYIKISGIVEDLHSLRIILNAIDFEPGSITSAEEQDQIWDKLVRVKESLSLDTLGDDLRRLPFPVDALIVSLNKAREDVNLIFDVVDETTPSKEGLDAVVGRAKDKVEQIREAYNVVKELIALKDKTSEIILSKAYLEEAASEELGDESLVQQREELLACLDHNLARGNRRQGFFNKLLEFKEKYIDKYVSFHERAVGSLAPLDDIEKLRSDRRFGSLKNLLALRVQAAISYSDVASEVNNVLAQRCDGLKKEELYQIPICNCGFPKSDWEDISGAETRLNKLLDGALTAYEEVILKEAEIIQKNIDNVEKENAKSAILEFLKTKKFKLSVSAEFVSGLNQALEEIHEIVVDVVNVAKAIYARKKILKWTDFWSELENELKKVKPTGVPDEKIRVRIKAPHELEEKTSESG